MTTTHWKKKLADVNWIGTHILPDGKDIIVTLLSVQWMEKLKVMGQNKDSFIASFATNTHFDKPMLLNKTNLKRITKITGTPNIENWTNLNIPVILCQEMDKAIGGGQDWALRIKQYNPPVLLLGSENFNKCKAAIKGGHKLSEIKLKYLVTPEVEKGLIHE